MDSYRTLITFIWFYFFASLLIAVSAEKPINAKLFVFDQIEGASNGVFVSLDTPMAYLRIVRATDTNGIDIQDNLGNLLMKIADSGSAGDVQAVTFTINGKPVNVVAPTDSQALVYDSGTDTIRFETISGVAGTIDVQEEGVTVSTSGTTNYVGSFVTAGDVGGVATVTIQNPTFENIGNVSIIGGASNDVLLIGSDNTTVVNLPKRAVQRLEYNIAGTIIGVPNQGEILGIIPFSDSVLFDTNLPNSRVYAATAPVAAASVFFHFNDKVNDIWAVAAWAAGATEAVITATETIFTSVNTLMIKAPNPADADLNTIGFNIKGTKQ